MSDVRTVGRQQLFTDDVCRAIPVWLAMGASTSEIADALGTTEKSLQMACSSRRISLSQFKSIEAVLLRHFRNKDRDLLREEARRRKVPITRLVADVMLGVVRYNLYAAVLGDYDEDAGS